MEHFVEVAASVEEPTNSERCRNGPPVSITITRGAAAHALLTSSPFVEQWCALQASCPWATLFQGPGFAAAWYDEYQREYEPVLVQGYSSQGKLVGLLELACAVGAREVVVAGVPQSEYQVWLALPSCSEAFFEAALEQLGATFGGSLTFAFLPTQTPLEWLRANTRLAGRCRIEAVPRPFLQLGEASGELLRQFWRNKTVRNQLNRLKRLGPVRLERLTEVAQLEPIFDEIIAHYDCRIGALLGYPPFWNDPHKKRFLLRLLAVPELLHVTILWAGKTIVGANLGFRHNESVILGVVAHSPFQAKCSPGKLMLMMLAEQLQHDGFSELDLTPDGEWKEQQATCQETVHKLTVYLRQSANLKSQLRERIKGAAKRLLQTIGVNPQRLAAVFHRARTLRPRHIPQAIRLQAARMFRAKGLQIYSVKPAGLADQANELRTSVDCLDHLLAGVDGAERSEVKSFFSSALKRFEAGCRVYTCLQDGKLRWSCWSIAGNGQIAVPQVEPTFVPPVRSAVLFAFRTASADSAEVNRACLLEVLHHLAENNELETVYLLIDAHDLQMCRVAESIGAVFERTHHQAPGPQHPAGEGEVNCPSATSR